MSDGFFGTPRSAEVGSTTVDTRPRPGPARPRTRSAGATPSRRGPARSVPPRRPRAPRPGPRPTAAPRSARPARPARPPAPSLTGSQLRKRTLRRLGLFAVAMAAVVAAICYQLVQVQVVDRGRYVAYGQTQRDGLRDIPASRGVIYDRSGRALAMSVAQPQVIVDASQADPESVDDTTASLVEILDVDAEEVRSALVSDSQYRIVAKEIDADQAEQIRALRDDGELSGVRLEDTFVRNTPNGTLARGVLGTALADGQTDTEGNEGGISGIEHAYDEQLSGDPGTLYFEKDVAGEPIAGGAQRLDEATQGADLYLTIDQTLQYEAEQTLIEQVAATGATGGQAVVMRPSTGEILTMASVTDTDDGEPTQSIDNRPVTAVFEPGSTMKMVTIAAALEEGTVQPDTMFNVPDTLQIYDRPFTDSHPHPDAYWSVTDILVTSSNIGTIKVAQQLGRESVDRYLRDFGFGSSTGLGFPAEEDGIMKDLEDWSGVDIGTVPIGQGISVTSLQMLAAYNVIANDGVYVAPKLVGATDTGRGQVPTEPAAGRRVISTETATQMRAMLAKVVTDGTGEPAAVPGYEAAGKTGTARLAQGTGGEDGYVGEDGRYHYQASFVGMINGADLSVIVSVEDPRTSIYGSDVAAPVFSHLAATALRRYEVPPPALTDPARDAVPELSASAQEVDGGEVVGGTAPAAG